MPKQPVGYLPSHQSSLDPSELSFGLDLNSVKPWGVGDEPSQLPNCDHQYEDRHMFNPRFSFTIQCIVGEASQDKPIVNHCCCLPSWIMFCNIHRRVTSHPLLGSILWFCQITPDWNWGSKTYQTSPTTCIRHICKMVLCNKSLYFCPLHLRKTKFQLRCEQDPSLMMI